MLRVYLDQVQLKPDEPINATVYALVSQTSQSVIDQSITMSKLGPDVQSNLVPTGAIMMFANNCPTVGWTRYSALDNRFPMGSPTGGQVGGDGLNELWAFTSRQGSGSQGFAAELIPDQTPSPAPILPPYETLVFCIKN